MLITLRQIKKRSKIAKKRLETLMNLYIDFYKLIKSVQERMKKYYDFKRSKGLDLKEEDEVWLLYKNFKSKQLSKKLDYVKLGLFKIFKKITEVMYKLDLLKKIKIYLV